MIQVHSATGALAGLLAADPVLVSSGFRVEEGEAFNQEAGHTPWVGVYYGDLTLEPHLLGGNGPWRAQLELLVYVQEASHRSGLEATQRLSAAQSAVLELLAKNRTLGDTVLMLNSLKSTPFQRELDKDTWLFTNEISVRAELRG